MGGALSPLKVCKWVNQSLDMNRLQSILFNRFFGRQIAQTLSDIIGFTVPCLPNVMLLNDDSFLSTAVPSKNPRRMFFLGLIAAKKMLVMRWKPPHTLSVRLWKRQFHNILILEASIARINNAKTGTFEALEGAAALL